MKNQKFKVVYNGDIYYYYATSAPKVMLKMYAEFGIKVLSKSPAPQIMRIND